MRILFSLFILCFLQVSNAQIEIDFPDKSKKELKEIRESSDVDLNGLWEAEITQESWNGQPELSAMTGKLHVEIEHKGNKINGLIACRAKLKKDGSYLSYNKIFTGLFDGSSMQYQDIAVEYYVNTSKQFRHLETCLKKANLKYYQTSSYEYLEGEWEGLGHISEISCVPGKIRLRRVKDEEIVYEEAQTINVNFEQKKGQPVFLKWGKDGKVKKIKKRKVEEGKIVTVEKQQFTITVYDHKRNDGDIISLNYNGNWILEKFRIDNDEHHIDVLLDVQKDNPNYLILYAHNLGAYAPNTCAVIIDDGVKKQRYILNSDMNTCDVIYFELDN